MNHPDSKTPQNCQWGLPVCSEGVKGVLTCCSSSRWLTTP